MEYLRGEIQLLSLENSVFEFRQNCVSVYQKIDYISFWKCRPQSHRIQIFETLPTTFKIE